MRSWGLYWIVLPCPQGVLTHLDLFKKAKQLKKTKKRLKQRCAGATLRLPILTFELP
jgi:hypothetical protein